MKIFSRFTNADALLMIVCVLFSPIYAFLLRSSLLTVKAMPVDIDWATENFYRIFRLNLSFSRHQQEPVSTDFMPAYINTFMVSLAFTVLMILVRVAWIFLAERKQFSQQKSSRDIVSVWVKFSVACFLLFLFISGYILYAPVEVVGSNIYDQQRQFWLTRFEIYGLFPSINLLMYFSLLGVVKAFVNLVIIFAHRQTDRM